MYLKEAHWFCD